MRLWSREEGEYVIASIVQETHPSFITAEVCRLCHITDKSRRPTFEKYPERVADPEFFLADTLTTPLHIDKPAEGVEGWDQEVAGGLLPQPVFIPVGENPREDVTETCEERILGESEQSCSYLAAYLVLDQSAQGPEWARAGDLDCYSPHEYGEARCSPSKLYSHTFSSGEGGEALFLSDAVYT